MKGASDFNFFKLIKYVLFQRRPRMTDKPICNELLKNSCIYHVCVINVYIKFILIVLFLFLFSFIYYFSFGDTSGTATLKSESK